MPVGASLGAAAIGGVTSLAGGMMQKSAADKASQVQREMYGQARTDLEPYRTAGTQATNMLMGRLPELTAPITLDAATLQQLPGYQFTLQQGLKGVQNSAAARGLGTSGAALKSAAAYSTGLANQYAGDAFNRELAQRQQTGNLLMGPAQLGAGAAGGTATAALNTGQQIGSNTMGGATAMAAGLQGAGNALTNAAGQYGGYKLGQEWIAANANKNTNNSGGYWSKSNPPPFQFPVNNLLTRDY